jgi:hypothetical protein
LELKVLDFQELYFPRAEWQWLRPAVHYPTQPSQSPDAFVWAANVNGKLWAWHPKGTSLSNAFPGMKTRVLVLETDGSELAAHGLYLKTTFENTPGLDIEWVCALDVAATRLGVDLSSPQAKLPPFWPEALKANGLEAHLGVLAQRARFRFLRPSERQLVFDKKWDLSVFELVETMEPGLRDLLAQAVRKWNLTAAQAKDAANQIMMLTRKVGEKAARTLLSGTFKGAEEFRVALHHTAQPELAILTQKRIDMLRGLHLPPRCSVFGDPTFEKDVLKITHSPRNIGDFEEFKEWVSDPEVLAKIKALLEIYQ